MAEVRAHLPGAAHIIAVLLKSNSWYVRKLFAPLPAEGNQCQNLRPHARERRLQIPLLPHLILRQADMLLAAADEVNALVLDVGSLYVKGGYAGEDNPKALFPSVSK